MKTITLTIFLCVLFSSSTCKKEGPDCHREIVIINNSDSTIIQAFKFYDINDNCILSGNAIQADSSFIHSRKYCLEDILHGSELYELFILDPNNYNTQGIFYNCDSIAIKNTILKHYKLTLDDLEQNDFTIIYQ